MSFVAIGGVVCLLMYILIVVFNYLSSHSGLLKDRSIQ